MPNIQKLTGVICTLAGVLAGCQATGPLLETEAPFTTPTQELGTSSSSLTSADRARLDASLKQAAALTVDAHASYRLLSTGNEGTKVYLTPAVVGPKDAPWLVVELAYRATENCGVKADAVYTSDAWATRVEASATVYDQGERQFLAFSLPAKAAGTQVEWAAVLRTCYANQWQDAYWINNLGQNFRYRVVEEAALSFLGNGAAWVDGIATNRVGGSVHSGHDLVVTVESYPEVAGAKYDLHFQVDGAAAKTVAMMFDGAGKGESKNNLGYQAAIETSRLPKGARVDYWVSATDAVGTTLWDSRSGRNYQVTVGGAAQVAWAGAGMFTYSKFASTSSSCAIRMFAGDYNNWCFGPGLVNPFKANSGIYQPYASFPYLALEVYVPGVTDLPVDAGTAAAIGAQFLKVELVSDLTGTTAMGPWAGLPMKYATRRGNNFIYSYMPVCPGGSSTFCGVGATPDGTYAFKFRASTDRGASWTWVGTEDLPSGGVNRTLIWDFQPPYER